MLFVLPHERRRAEQLPVLVVAVAGDLDVEVAVGREPPVFDVQLEVGPAGRAGLVCAEEGDLVAWRPGEVDDAAVQACDLLWLAALGGDGPHRVDLLQAGGLASVRKEGDVRAIGRPGGRVDVVGGGRDSCRLWIVDVGDPDAHELIPDADAVEAPGVVADPSRDRVVGVADDEALLAAGRDQEELLAVGRPVRGGHAAGDVGDLARLAAREVDDPCLGLAGAVGDEDERAAVGREARPVVAGLGAGELLRFGGVEVRAPQPSRVLAVFDSPLDVDDARSVRRHRQGRDHDLAQDVLGLEWGLGLGFGFLSLDRLHVLRMHGCWKSWRS